jgi:phage baseplate assembly protein gpV
MKQSRKLIQSHKQETLEAQGKFYGFYWGIVVESPEENTNGVIRVAIPEVFGYKVVLKARAKGVFSGKGYGYNFVPQKDEIVTISFKNGASDHPFWEPGFYADGEKPEEFTSKVIGHKYRDGAMSLYDEETSTFKIITANKDLITFKGSEYKLVLKDGAEITISGDTYTYKNPTGDTLTQKGGSFKYELASGPRVELGTSGVQLAGHGVFSHAVLGAPLVSVLTTLLGLVTNILLILTSHDTLISNANGALIEAMGIQVTETLGTLNSILAT